MKKWAILLLAVGLVVVIWYFARRQEYVPPWAQPKYGELTRGDIRVPITASGLIHADLVVEVKPEASGEIVDVKVVEGTYVDADEVLVELNPDDEQRMLDRAQADYDRAQAMLTQTKVAVDRAAVSIESAKSRVREMEAQSKISEYELEKIKGWKEAGRQDMYNPQELNNAQAQHDMVLAQIESGKVAIRSAELAKLDAEAAVKSQEALVESAHKALEDAAERLSETTIVAPREGIITQVFVKPGMLVQSGTQSLTGGTPLMILADVSKKKVIARLDEADYGRVLDISPLDALPEMPALREAAEADAAQIEKRAGRVQITADAFPDDVFAGRIERVEPQGKLNAGSSIIQFDVHVEITDEQRQKLPLGAQAQVEFTVESAVGVLRVPAEAVMTHQNQRGVWLKVPPDASTGDEWGKRFVPCRFGISDGEFTQVIAALGNEKLSEGAQVYTRLPREAASQE